MALKVLRAAAYAVLTWWVILALADRFPVMRAATEEARIFNAENADSFGEDPYVYTELSLQKIVAASAGDYALMSIDGEERQFLAGDLVAEPCLKLSRILLDAVLLDHCGSYILLWQRRGLDQPATMSLRLDISQKGQSQEIKPSVVDLRADVDVRHMVSDYRRRLYDRPLSLLGAIDVKVVDGVRGREYIISEGRDKQIFAALGLKSGDRVLAFNGVDLSRYDAPTQIYEDLDDVNYLAISLARGQERRVVLLDLEPLTAASD